MSTTRREMLLQYCNMLREKEMLYERMYDEIIELYPTREDLEQHRGAAFIYLLERLGEEYISSWINFQELNFQLTDTNRLCIKDQTTDERAIIRKGLRLQMYIDNEYKRIHSKYYIERFSDLEVNAQVDYLMSKVKKCFFKNALKS